MTPRSGTMTPVGQQEARRVTPAQRAARRGRTTAAGLAAVALLATACSTNREVTRPEPKPVTDELLATALLTDDDLTGFEPAPTSTPAATELVPEHECDDALADLEPRRQASADFTNGTNRLSVSVAWYPGGGQAVERLHRQIRDRCEQVVVAEQGLSLRTGPLDFGVLSDDTFPVRFEVEPESGSIEERDLILIRDGDLVTTIRLVGPRPSDKTLLDSVVRIAIGRLGGVALEVSGGR